MVVQCYCGILIKDDANHSPVCYGGRVICTMCNGHDVYLVCTMLFWIEYNGVDIN